MENKKVILITGASSGMGKSTAQDLIKAGHIVYCVARSVDKMKDLEMLGGHVMKMDVTDEENIDSVVKKLSKNKDVLMFFGTTQVMDYTVQLKNFQWSAYNNNSKLTYMV